LGNKRGFGIKGEQFRRELRGAQNIVLRRTILGTHIMGGKNGGAKGAVVKGGQNGGESNDRELR